MTETRYNNAGRLYPNGFYWTASHLVSTNIENSVERVRIMNVLLFVVLLIAVNALLPIELRRSLNTTHVLLLMPLGLFLIASNNPSSWAISGLGTFWAFLYGFLTMTSRFKMVGAAFFTLLSAFMAIQARADSAAFTVVISVVVSGIVIFKNSEMRGQIYRRLLLPLFILIPAFLSFSGSSQSKAISTGLLGDESYGRDPLAIFLWNITRLPGMFAGIFGYPGAGGGLGWLDIAMPEIVSIGMIFLTGYLVAQSATSRSRGELGSLIFFLGIICAMPLMILQKDGAVVGENFQSRYLLPSLLAAGGLYFTRSTKLYYEGDIKSPKVIAFIVLVIAYLVSLHTTIRRYVTGNDIMDWNLNRDKEWWWNGVPSPMTVFVSGSMAFAILMFFFLFQNKTTTATKS